MVRKERGVENTSWQERSATPSFSACRRGEYGACMAFQATGSMACSAPFNAPLVASSSYRSRTRNWREVVVALPPNSTAAAAHGHAPAGRGVFGFLTAGSDGGSAAHPRPA